MTLNERQKILLQFRGFISGQSGERGGLVVESLTPEREAGGSIPASVTERLLIGALSINTNKQINQHSQYQLLSIFKWGKTHTKYCLVYMVLDIKLAYEFSEYSHLSQRTKSNL